MLDAPNISKKKKKKCAQDMYDSKSYMLKIKVRLF